MKFLMKIVAFWCVATLVVGGAGVTIGSCLSTRSGAPPDLLGFGAQLNIAAQGLSDMALIVEQTDPDLAADLNRMHDGVILLDEQVQTMIETGASLDLQSMIDELLLLSDPLVNLAIQDPARQARARLIILGLRLTMAELRAAQQ